MSMSRSSTTIILVITLIVFFTSIWHTNSWNSIDLTFTNDSPVQTPSYIDDAHVPDTSYGQSVAPTPMPPKVDPRPSDLKAEGAESTKEKPPTKPKSKPWPRPTSTSSEKELTFYEVAKKHGTDKVTTHSYHKMYQKYIGPIRLQPLKMLEIGLGCDMNYGPGKSYYTWLEWLPNVDLYYIEYDVKCAEKWAKETSGATVESGDQADVSFLNEFMEKHGKNFDIIIDDGGHQMYQQKTSLDILWQAVKPGGIYFCEDLQTSYMEIYGGSLRKEDTMVEYIKSFLDDMHMKEREGHPENKVMKDVGSIDCMTEVCAFSKPPAIRVA